ncbi:MAG: TonB-dependent receptor [Bacteroidota bacterium]|nr:TonB-dependent receptor [Bacteroidota bacterium]
MKRIFSVSIFSIIMFIYTDLQAQVTIHGEIQDETNGTPVEFAAVSIKSSNTGTTSDDQGKFTIQTKQQQNVNIQITHLNYHKKDIPIRRIHKDSSIIIKLSPRQNKLNEVIVSANLYEQKLYKLTRSANIINNHDIENNMQSNLIDVLASTPGFTQVWEYHSPLILRGLNAKRLIVMIDGNRRIGTFPGGYFGQKMNVYDASKFEIIKGPGSVIYGSGAISGIINFQTTGVLDDSGTHAKFLTGYGTNNNEFLEHLKACHKGERFGISIQGKYRHTNNMKYGNGDIAENSNVEDRDISIKSGIKPAENHTIRLYGNYHYGDWGKARGFNGPTKRFTKIRNKEENFHSALQYTWNIGKFAEQFQLNGYYDDGFRDYYKYKYNTITNEISQLDLVHYKHNYGGGRAHMIFNAGKNNKLNLGTDAFLFFLDTPTELFDYYDGSHGELEGYENAGQQNTGVFMSDDYQVNDKIMLSAGIRFDMARVFEGETMGKKEQEENRQSISGNAGISYRVGRKSYLSLNMGRAFRMPTTEELFTEIISCKGTKKGNPDLQPEYSNSLDIGIRGSLSDSRFRYDLALFANQMEGYINEAPDTSDADVDFTYLNTDAILTGGEFSMTYQVNRLFSRSQNLYISTGGSYVYGIDQTGNDALFGIPPFQGKSSVEYRSNVQKLNAISGIRFLAEIKYAAPQNRIASIPEGTDGGPWGYIPSDAYAIVNLGAGLRSLKIPGNPKLQLRINNLFNLDYKPFGSYIPAMGRNIKLVFTFNV